MVYTCVIGFFLLWPYLVAAKTTDSVRFHNNRLAVKVDNTSVEQVMRKVAEQAGIMVTIYGRLDRRISTDFNNVPLETGLRKLLARLNTSFLYVTYETDSGQKQSILEKVFIFSDGQSTGSTRFGYTVRQRSPAAANEKIKTPNNAGRKKGKAQPVAIDTSDKGLSQKQAAAPRGVSGQVEEAEPTKGMNPVQASQTAEEDKNPAAASGPVETSQVQARPYDEAQISGIYGAEENNKDNDPDPAMAEALADSVREEPEHGGFTLLKSDRELFKQTAPETLASQITASASGYNQGMDPAKAGSQNQEDMEESVSLQITSIQKKSLFSKLGLQTGDIILNINGTKIDRAEQLTEEIYRIVTGPGSPMLRIEVERGGAVEPIYVMVE